MQRKKMWGMAVKTFTLAILVVLGLALVGCGPAEEEEEPLPTVEKHAPWGNAPNYYSGRIEAVGIHTHEEAAHAGVQARLVLDITLVNGEITDVDWSQSTNVSTTHGLAMLARSKPVIIQYNTVDIPYIPASSSSTDAVTRATMTYNAMKTSGLQALNALSE